MRTANPHPSPILSCVEKMCCKKEQRYWRRPPIEAAALSDLGWGTSRTPNSNIASFISRTRKVPAFYWRRACSCCAFVDFVDSPFHHCMLVLWRLGSAILIRGSLARPSRLCATNRIGQPVPRREFCQSLAERIPTFSSDPLDSLARSSSSETSRALAQGQGWNIVIPCGP